jgi:SWI/SNF-related matrix-associated actin-dependent regulator 1 of chromatin subfamily A
MEGPVKGKQLIFHCAIALSLLTGVAGCQKDDSAAVAALQELTGQLSEKVAEQNEELTSLTAEVQTCMKDLATTKGEAVVVSGGDATIAVPSLEGEATAESLEALKTALNDTIKKQEAAMKTLQSDAENCAKDLEAAKEEAEAAAAEAEAAAAAEAEAKAKEAAARAKRRAAKKKPTAVREAEKTGAPTKGTRSRY